MATINPKTADGRESVTGFGGIADHAEQSAHAASDSWNFRILSDGSLEKRCGYLKRYAFPLPLRGLWEGVVNGESYFFAVAGNQVYLRAPGETTPHAIYVLTTSEGEVSLFLYNDRVYLMDGASLLRFQSGRQTFTVAQGYVPLYGYNWHPTELGAVNEPLNLLRPEIRIHYFNSNGSTTFNLPYTTQRIQRVAVNGTAITTYTFQPNTSSFSIPPAYSTVGSVEVLATVDPIFVNRSSVLSGALASVFRTPHRETVLCYGGGAGYLVYRTTPVSDEMLNACNLAVSDGDPFYVAKNTAFAVGSSSHPVTALCQYEDRMLVMNDESAWTVHYPEADSNEVEILPVRAGLGCAARRGVTVAGKYPVAITPAGIARLKFSDADFEYCDVEILSAGLRERFDGQFLTHATLFWDPFHQELWVRDPNDSAGSVWIYNPEREVWSRFRDIPARFFFPFEGKVGFADEDGVSYFDDTLVTDNGQEIGAQYVSHFLAAGDPRTPKRSLRVTLVAEGVGDPLTTTIGTGGRSREIRFDSSPESLDAPVCFDRRLAMGRFRLLQFTIRCVGMSRPRIYSYSIAANH